MDPSWVKLPENPRNSSEEKPVVLLGVFPRWHLSTPGAAAHRGPQSGRPAAGGGTEEVEPARCAGDTTRG